jgi:hypothetical protein
MKEWLRLKDILKGKSKVDIFPKIETELDLLNKSSVVFLDPLAEHFTFNKSDLKHTMIIGQTDRGGSRFLKEEADRLGVETLDKKNRLINQQKTPEELNNDKAYISVNIWDDFYDDGYVPDGEIQETYAYIEDDNLTDNVQKECLALLIKYIKKTTLFPNDDIELSFYDSAKVYPNLVGTEHEYCLYKRWQIQFKSLTHSKLDDLVEQLNKASIHHAGVSLKIYSES